MRCKAGDLAYFAHSTSGNYGLVVQCLRLATQSELDEAWFVDSKGPVWVIDRKVRTSNRLSVGSAALARDMNLRPIRDQPGTDETLSWAPVPVDIQNSITGEIHVS